MKAYYIHPMLCYGAFDSVAFLKQLIRNKVVDVQKSYCLIKTVKQLLTTLLNLKYIYIYSDNSDPITKYNYIYDR